MAEWLDVGDEAPDFTLLDDKDQPVTLSQFRPRPVVLYFYPRDDTPGCTRQACGFRDARSEIADAGVVVIGISGDDVASHAKFRDKFQLNFPLLADPDHEVSTRYGAYREKNLYGKKSMGIVRSTYLIGGDGRILKVYKRVSVDGHAADVLTALSH